MLGSPYPPAEKAAFDARRRMRGTPHRPALLSCTFDVRSTWLHKILIGYKFILNMLLKRTGLKSPEIPYPSFVLNRIFFFGGGGDFIQFGVSLAPSGNCFFRRFHRFFTFVSPRSNQKVRCKFYWHGIFVNKNVFPTF